MNKTEIIIWNFGVAGVGKSALFNTLVDDKSKQTFPEIKPSRSSNQEFIKIVPVTLRTGHSATLIDTEGFSSPDIPEQTLYDQTYERLKEVKSVNRFVLVLNSSEPRVDAKIQKMVGSFVTMIGVGILDYLSVVFTRWSHDSRSARARERQGVSEASKTKEINDFFRINYNFNGSVPCYFIDCGFEESDEGAENCIQQQRKLIEGCMNSAPFETTNVQKVNLHPVINYNNYSNSESGDIYNKRMTDRRNLVSPIEKYFDCRELNVIPSLINDVRSSFPPKNSSRFQLPWLSEKNYKAHLMMHALVRLSSKIETSLGIVFGNQKIGKESKFSFVSRHLKDPDPKNESLYGQAGLAIIMGGTIGTLLDNKFWKPRKDKVSAFLSRLARKVYRKKYALSTCLLFLVVWIAGKKTSWSPEDARNQAALELTQQIAYTNGMKKACIELADRILEDQPEI